MGANISCCDGPLGSLSVAEQQHLTSQRHAPSSEAPPLLPHHLSGFAPLHTTTPCELGGAGSTNRWEERGSPCGMWRSSAMASSARLTASDNMTTIEEGHADMALRIPSPPGEEEEACASFLVVGASADTAQFEVVAEEQQHHAPMLACGASSAPTIDRQPPLACLQDPHLSPPRRQRRLTRRRPSRLQSLRAPLHECFEPLCPWSTAWTSLMSSWRSGHRK
ncbi:Hypothetical protein, putative [Bodo saltans]|uniref:Uncharacterized protein n=1 Tax=Bodo saltans TaxID=75058 RepID=A0A0S4ISV2_BODSA|nr:Hypothetical protein, putative [Bodo saltans]|eukprot:CUF73201.1 Hypothetical protein, putative [Bodo saltans]